MVYSPLCNFDARIVAEETHDDGVEQTTHFTIEGLLCNGRRSTTKVAAARFNNLAWITEAWGNQAVAYAGFGTKDHLRTAIQLLSRDVPRRTVFTHMGWRKIDGQRLYLHAEGAIGPNGPVSGINVSLGDGRLNDYSLPEPPSGEELRKAVRASLAVLELAPPSVTYPLLAATHRAPLGEVLPVDLSVFLAGPTGVQKTELTALAQAHFGAAFNGKNLPGNWNSTSNTLEKQAFLAQHGLFTVDDFSPSGTVYDAQRLHREADRLLRGQGNRAGRGRMRADGTLRPEYFPRGLIMSSGEDMPRGHSLRARCLFLELSKGDVDLRKLTEAQGDAADGLLAQAMAAYIRWLASQLDKLMVSLPERHCELRTKAREGDVVHDRTPDQVASLFAGWEIFLRFAQEEGAINEEETVRLSEACWQALGEAAQAQAAHQVASEATRRFVGLLAAAIGSGRAHVASPDSNEPSEPERWGWRSKIIGTGENTREEWQAQGVCIGWIDGGDLYLEPEASYQCAQGMAGTSGDGLAISQRTLAKRLNEKKLLVTTGGKRGLIIRKTLQGSRREVLHLNAEKVMPAGGEHRASPPAEKPAQPAQSAPDVSNRPKDRSQGDLDWGATEPVADESEFLPQPAVNDDPAAWEGTV
ncbi:hypothetical protein ACFL6C_03375 [Myxococcota bacterium]